MDETQWRHMATAPKDGTRVLVTIRPVEQGAADVDVAYWAQADSQGIEGWRAADSAPGAVIGYADPELKCWMPLPEAGAGQPAASIPGPYEGDDLELDGSGI